MDQSERNALNKELLKCSNSNDESKLCVFSNNKHTNKQLERETSVLEGQQANSDVLHIPPNRTAHCPAGCMLDTPPTTHHDDAVYATQDVSVQETCAAPKEQVVARAFTTVASIQQKTHAPPTADRVKPTHNELPIKVTLPATPKQVS